MRIAKTIRTGQSLKTYTSTDILKLGIKRERLKDWIERGLVQPSIQKAAGQGTTHLFSIYDLYLIKLFERLVSRGLSRIDAELRIRWLSELIRGGEEGFWRDLLFMLFVNIGKEQTPVLKRLSDSRLSGKFVQDLTRLSSREYKLSLGSFVPVPIWENPGTEPSAGLYRQDSNWLCISREISNDCDDLILVNVKKMREEINSLVL
jgi:hypothetical protein